MHCAIGWLHQVPAGDEGPPREPQAALRDLGLAGRDDATTTFVESRIAATAPAPQGGDNDKIRKGGLLQLCVCNDPSAGSPTETLLRLLLPLNDKV
jgi:hypothetical protein